MATWQTERKPSNLLLRAGEKKNKLRSPAVQLMRISKRWRGEPPPQAYLREGLYFWDPVVSVSGATSGFLLLPPSHWRCFHFVLLGHFLSAQRKRSPQDGQPLKQNLTLCRQRRPFKKCGQENMRYIKNGRCPKSSPFFSKAIWNRNVSIWIAWLYSPGERDSSSLETAAEKTFSRVPT